MKYLVSIGLLLLGCGLRAQNVGFGDGEIATLKDWLGAPGAEGSLVKLYSAQKEIADRAMLEDPHPIDTIRSEGLLQGDPKKTATQEALKDMAKMYALALVYKVSGDGAYLRAAERYLHAWAEKNHSRGDPIDDTNLDPAIEAYDMVKGKRTGGGARKEERAVRDEQAEHAVQEERAVREDQAVRDWLRRTADMEITAVYNRPNRATSYNNWHSHRLKIVGEIGFATDDTALQGYAIRGLQAQIGRNLRPDGPSEDFVTRDALHYHVYDLEPLLRLAIVLKRATGVDYYLWVSPTGSSIQRSVAWLLPFVTGEKTHAEFVNSTVEFDRRRAANGEAAYKAGTLWEPKNGIGVLELAAFFDPSLMSLARKLSGDEGKYPGWQAVADGLFRDGI